MLRITFAAAGVALLPILQLAGQQTGRDDANFIWSKALAAGATVSIRNGDGPIDVRESPNDRIEVRAVKRARGRASNRDVTFDVRETGGDAMICTVYEGSSLCDRDRNRRSTRNVNVRVDYTVLIPRSMRVNVLTGNGEISVDKAGAEVDATTGNGRVSIGETSGRVNVTTGNGDVQIEQASGPVRVTTGNGQIFAATSNGPVTATTGNGDISVRIKALTATSPMDFTTGSGTIRVSLPADYNGTIDASTGSGSLRSDFEISIVGRIDAHHLRGTIGKGGPLLRLSTGSGSVELRKG